MRLSTLLLLTLTVTVSTQSNGQGFIAHQNNVDTNLLENPRYSSGLAEIHRSFFDTPTRDASRHKRTPFLRDWLKLIRTTIWGGRYTRFGLKAKTFFKFGTEDTAINDFYSLNPTAIEKEADLLIGKVGNQVIVLGKREDGPPILSVADSDSVVEMGVKNSNKSNRQIIYYKNLDEKLYMIRRMESLRKPTH